MDSIYYPRLLRRIQAMLIDSLVLVTVVYAIVFLPPMDDWSFIKPTLVVAVVFFLDPALVSFTGGTIGHHWLNIRVTRLSGRGKINVLAATVRFILKTVLGWFSLILVLTTRRHQALHDLVARSLVVYRKTEHLPTYEKLTDRSSLNEAYLMPSWWRRMMVTLAYILAVLIGYCAAAIVMVSDPCLTDRICSNLEQNVLNVGNIVWIFASSTFVVFGWRGQLFGCRRTARR